MWELKIDRVPGQSITIEATINGQKWTGVGTLNKADMKLNLRMNSELSGKKYFMNFDLNPAGQWGMHITGDIDGPLGIQRTIYVSGDVHSPLSSRVQIEVHKVLLSAQFRVHSEVQLHVRFVESS